MQRTLIAVVVSFLAVTAFALPPEARGPRPEASHYILTPQRQLNEQEQADLASRGITILRPLTGGKFLVRVSGDPTSAGADPRIASLEPLTATRKLHASAVREVASGRPNVRLDVLFMDGVRFDDAKAAIAAAGGSLFEPLQNDFHVPRRITVRIASTAVTALASDERVMLVYGPRHLIPKTDNAEEAAAEHVTPLYSPPYGLSGQGVVLSYFELADADAVHPEFSGRLIVNGPFQEKSTDPGYSDDHLHATHTGGTMIAAGVDAQAKGMAPQATLQEFDTNADNMLDLKKGLSKFHAAADNNSWGYILGWCSRGDCSPWTWSGNELYYGGYDSQISAPVDQITRSNGVLFVHSAGNEAQNVGPTTPPFTHKHFDDKGKTVTGYCYSADGSGTDCPAPACKAGKDSSGQPFCETTRHPQITELLPAPWVSVGITAAAKNVIAVGAVNQGKGVTSFSSRGPTRDGRVKPDIVSRGLGVYSTEPGNTYGFLDGTSMAAPQVTGTSALLVEQWRRTMGGADPTPQQLKTLMMATADDLGNPGPDYTYGFGLLNAQAAVDAIVADGGQARRIVTNTVQTGQEIDLPITINSAQNLRITLGWADPEPTSFPVDSGDPTDPLAAQTLVNDLDLSVVDGSGNTVLPYVLDPKNPGNNATRGVNKVDNIEEVEIANAPPGVYKIAVKGTAVNAQSPQTFVLVANADVGAAIRPCTEGPFGDNSTPATAYGNIVSRQTLIAHTCTASDVDYFKFIVDKSGQVSVTVTATDTPVKVTLSSGATQDVVATIAPGTSQTLATNVAASSAAPVQFFVRVEPAGTIGTSAQYSITPSFPYANNLRRRSVGHH